MLVLLFKKIHTVYTLELETAEAYCRLGYPAPILCVHQGLVQACQHHKEDPRQEDQDSREGQRGLEACHDQHEQQGGHHSRGELDEGVPLCQL